MRRHLPPRSGGEDAVGGAVAQRFRVAQVLYSIAAGQLYNCASLQNCSLPLERCYSAALQCYPTVRPPTPLPPQHTLCSTCVALGSTVSISSPPPVAHSNLHLLQVHHRCLPHPLCAQADFMLHDARTQMHMMACTALFITTQVWSCVRLCLCLCLCMCWAGLGCVVWCGVVLVFVACACAGASVCVCVYVCVCIGEGGAVRMHGHFINSVHFSRACWGKSLMIYQISNYGLKIVFEFTNYVA